MVTPLDAESRVLSLVPPCIYPWGRGWCVPPRKAKRFRHLCGEGRIPLPPLFPYPHPINLLPTVLSLPPTPSVEEQWTVGPSLCGFVACCDQGWGIRAIPAELSRLSRVLRTAASREPPGVARARLTSSILLPGQAEKWPCSSKLATSAVQILELAPRQRPFSGQR